ncbi:Oidioi.mRNA.OKI2018_I69.PAR.g8488.t1.cds [Oikopleura dioica]|uniref:Oidioi.mRNA.OKI2018_I69.PAR.g8488.t1.cds n=1 Tax=Oikopleura dioica TaxID=34765 RepID=A0ABN7RG68_OIKDI|nr:Oidioi.mRNA.OKI2018_I69.PAR.g8488.t1.cds [Oikopleura dioica]
MNVSFETTNRIVTRRHIAMIESNNFHNYPRNDRLSTVEIHDRPNALTKDEMSWLEDSAILDDFRPRENLTINLHSGCNT